MLAKHSDDYMFRSSVNQLLLKTIDKIEVFAPRTEFNPWEIDPDQKMVRDFRKLFPKYQKASFNALLKKSEFERYVKMQDNKITIRFRAGGIRHVLTGQNISFMNKKIKDH